MRTVLISSRGAPSLTFVKYADTGQIVRGLQRVSFDDMSVGLKEQWKATLTIQDFDAPLDENNCFPEYTERVYVIVATEYKEIKV